MAQQIKKKYIQDDAIDGEKLKLVKDQSVRGEDQSGQEVDLLKLDQDDKVLLKGEEAALKSQVDAEQQRAEGEEARIEGKVDTEKTRAEGQEAAIRSEFAAADESVKSELKGDVEVMDTMGKLEDAINAEQVRAEGEESRIEGKVDTEISDRQSEITRVEGLVSAEEVRAMAEELRLAGLISDEEQARIDGDSDLDAKIQTEKARIDAILSTSEADKDSFAEIVALINSVDTTNDQAFAAYVLSNDAALAQEVSDRITGDQNLQSSLNSEQAARISQDGILQDNIDAEQTRAETAEATLQSNIDTEEAARIAGDADLQSKLDVETVRARSAEEDLQSALSAEESARIAGDTKILDSFKKEVLFETEAQIMGVSPDAGVPIANPNDASDEGWYFDKSLPGAQSKINWYFHYKSQAPVDLDENNLSVYFTSAVEAGHIFLGVYTSPEGDGNDASSWYRSRLVLEYDIAQVSLNQEYLFWAFNEPSADIRPELTRVELTPRISSIQRGPAGSAYLADGTRLNEMIDRIAINTDSSSSSAKVRVYDAGIQGEVYEKEIAFRIKDRVTLDEVMSLALQKSSMDAQRSEYLKLYTDYLHGLQQASIDAEVARATAAEQVNANAIAVLNGDSSVEGSVAKSIADVIDAAPEALDTLNELAAAINDDASFAASVTQQITDAKNELKGSVSEAFDTMKEIEDEFTKINGDSSVEGSVDYKVAAEAVLRSNADADLQSQIDQINTDVSAVVQFGKESIEVTSQMITDKYVDLQVEIKPNSMVMFVDRLGMHEGLDYSVSTVNGVSRITFLSPMLQPSEEALEAGQFIRVTYSK